MAMDGLGRFWNNRSKNDDDDDDHQDIVEEPCSTNDFLGKYGLQEEAIISSAASPKVALLINDVLSPDSVTSPEDVRGLEHDLSEKESAHRRKLRLIVLSALIVPMAITPLWLMVLLSVPVFNKNSDVSERLQLAYLAAVTSDCIGLCYIVTSNLFPYGGKRRKKDKDSES